MDELGGGLWITQPRRDAYIVTLGYTSPDSLLARDVPNAITATLHGAAAETCALRKRGARQSFCREQLERVDTELAPQRTRSDRFRSGQRMIDPQVETSSEVTRLVAKESERSAVEAERQALAASLAEIEASADEPGAPSPYRRLIGLPFLLRNQAASALLSSLITAENDRAARVRRRHWIPMSRC